MPIKLTFLVGDGALVHGCLDASVHFSGEDWVVVAVRTVSVLVHSVKAGTRISWRTP